MVFNPVAPLVQGRTWRGLTHLGLDWLIAAVTLSLVATLLVATVGTIPTIIVAIPMAWIFFGVAAGLGRMERSRAYALLDVDIEPPTPRWWRRLGWPGCGSGRKVAADGEKLPTCC
jgi:Putative sensor